MTIFPFVDIYLTRRCNLQCSYCGVYKEKKDEMTGEDWIEIFKWLKGKSRTISIFGGEPTMHKDFEQIVEGLNDLHMNYAICSNCSLPLKTLNRFAEIPVTTFGGSIDSLKDNFPDSWSRTKSLHALRILPIFQENGSNIILNFMACKTNWQELPVITEYCRKRGWHMCFNLFHGDKGGIFAGGSPSLALNQNEIEKLTKMILKEKDIDDTILGAREFFESTSLYGLTQNWHCNSYVTLMIDSDGQLLICREFAGEIIKVLSIWDLVSEVITPLEYKGFVTLDSTKCNGCFHEIHYTSRMIEEGLINEKTIF